MTVSEICFVVFMSIITAVGIIPMIVMTTDYFKEVRQGKRTLFVQILHEMEKLHKQKHEVNFILVSENVKGIDFDRVMGIPIEFAVLPKGVKFVVAERKEQKK